MDSNNKSYNCPGTIVGTNLYKFCNYSSVSSFGVASYKYNILTNAVTSIRNCPKYFPEGLAKAINNEIYLYGGSDSADTGVSVYKYNIETNQYTALSNSPLRFSRGGIANVGNDIYLFGGNYARAKAYKHNIIDDTYTKLADIPVEDTGTIYGVIAGVIDGEIFVLFDKYNDVHAFKYNPSTNTYTELTAPTYLTTTQSVTVGTSIYIFGDVGSTYNNNYRYDTRETFPEVQKMDYSGIESINDFYYENFVNDNVYIKAGLPFKTKLTDKLTCNLSDVVFFKNGKSQKYPIYYGDGTKWIKIK